MKFCYGTCETVFDHGKQVRYVKDIRKIVAQSVAFEAFEYGNRQNKLSDLVNGQENLLKEMVDGAKIKPVDEIAAYFRDKVMQFLDPNKLKIIFLALQWIIKSDDTIDGDTVVDLVNDLTKKEFLAVKRFLPYKTFAGLFIFSVRQDNNKGCGDDVKQLSKEFFTQFQTQAADIIVEKEEEYIAPNEITPLITEAQIAMAQARNDGFCPRCGKPLVFKDEDDIEINRSAYVTFNGRVMTVCEDCKKAAAVDMAVMTDAWSAQDDVDTQLQLADVSAGSFPKRKDIISVLKAIDEFEPGEDTGINDPHTIAEKIPSEKGLRKKVQGLISPSYGGIQRILNDLSGENAIDTAQIGNKVGAMWQSMRGVPATQEQVFDALVKGINDKSGHRFKSACEMLICYYIQRCDVFAVPQ